MSTATMLMPPAMSVGVPEMAIPKKLKADEPQTKHSFDSDAETTAILHHVLRAGANKARFVNLCIKYAASQAFEALELERKSAEQEFWQVVDRSRKPARKP